MQNLEQYLRYPPFFTLQPHPQSRANQIKTWSKILHNHFKKNKTLDTSIAELNSDAFTLFQDDSTAIPKRMTKEDISIILQAMANDGLIYFTGKENFTVQLFPVKELADSIYEWAKRNKLIGYTETLSGIIDGEDVETHQKFFDMPQTQIKKALELLEESGKAEVYDVDGIISVKFK